ncbi:S26 family signal peptidase [Hoeflea sp.]|uniref:S26 family signal peptidase n=1 Tax=Hoeflea sp. TaxID=1940281 RepID=UPI003B027783
MRRAHGVPAVMALGIALIAIPAFTAPRPILVWNASASVPAGLYAAQWPDAPAVGDLVLVRPPEPLGSWLAERGYVGPDTPLLKRIAALPGQAVCRRGAIITIDGAHAARAEAQDRFARPLPAWRGCHVLREGEFFLLNAGVAASLDGRYFGVLSQSAVVGRAVPLWTRAD